MSGTTAVYLPAGPTLGLSVAGTLHAAQNVTYTTNEPPPYVACLNTGATFVAIKFSVAGLAAALPGDGTTGDFVLGPSMQMPLILPLPSQQIDPIAGTTKPCQVTAIGSGAGPALVYITPLTIQR